MEPQFVGEEAEAIAIGNIGNFRYEVSKERGLLALTVYEVDKDNDELLVSQAIIHGETGSLSVLSSAEFNVTEVCRMGEFFTAVHFKRCEACLEDEDV